MALPKWAWVVIALVVTLVVGIIALAGAGLYFVSREVRVQSASPASAQQAFEAERARFSGQQPILEIRGDEVVGHHDGPERPPAGRRAPGTLRVLVWDSDEEKLVRINVPFWLLRLGRHGTLKVSSDEFDFERLNLTVDDLERLGPTLILDHREHGGTRVLLWTE